MSRGLKPDRRRRRAFAIAAIALGAAGGLLLAQLVLGGSIAVVDRAVERSTGVHPGDLLDERGSLTVSDDRCYAAWAPDQSAVHHRGSLRHVVFTDALGFRVPARRQGDDPTDDLRPECTILVVGDSFSEGLWVSAEEAWPARLETRLRARYPDVRVLNGGFRGHSISDERIAALGRWAELEPAVVVLAQTANDLDDLARHACPPGTPVPDGFTDTVESNAAIMPLERLRLAAEMWRESQRSDSLDSPDCDVLLAAYEDEFVSLDEGVESWGGALVYFQLERLMCPEGARITTDASGVAARLGRMADGHVEAIHVLWTPEFSLRPVDGHPSPAGHDEYARILAEELDPTLLAGCVEPVRE